jgi:rod shape determining protein RodA
VTPLGPITAGDEGAAEPPSPRPRLPLDPLMALAVAGLGVCSILTLKTATRTLIPGSPNYYVDRQALYLGVGLVLMLLLSRIDYSRLRRARNVIYGALIFSILAVIAAGHGVKGSTRAISLGGLFSFQASELGKDLLILALAAFIVDRSRQLGQRDTTVRVMLAALIPAMLVIVQPDLGSGMVYMVIAFTLLFIAGTGWKQLAALAALVVVAAAFVLAAGPAMGIHVLKPYQEERFTGFLHPSSNPQSEGYQLLESKIAIGAGQKTGRAHAPQTSLHFVPEDQTDFIFAALGERYGFVGAGLVLLLYALLMSRTLRVMVMAKDLYGTLVAAGVAGMLMFQVFVNVGMTIGIMPITGVTLPLMSYGGSSVITTLLAVGLLQSIYVQARVSEALKGRVLRH